MRQAGRYLPEYRAIREKTTFLGLCKDPDLASEVTVQPVDIVGVDAAILFSDILVIPEALGLKLDVIESKGPVFESPLRDISSIDALNTEDVIGRLEYVMEAIKATKTKLADRVPLIGFSGAPWTLATYMVEGQSSKSFETIKSFMYKEPKAIHKLLSLLADTVVDYLNAKIRAGCDAVQIFDTWAGVLSPSDLEEFSLSYIRDICERLETNGKPVIVFAKGVNKIERLASLKCDVLGIDWTQDLADARAAVDSKKALQGNLDPCVLFGTQEKIKSETLRILERFGSGNGHIFNLGHGILPKTPVENVRHLVETVKELSPQFHGNNSI